MKRGWLVMVVLVLGAGVAPGPEGDAMDDVMRSAEEWAQENLDAEALQALRSGDQARVKELFAELERQFHGEYVLGLGQLKETARALVPVLEGYEETAPYAEWLKARLDYLDVADELRQASPVPKPKPGQPAKPIPNPPPQQQRTAWIKKLAARPWPEAAKAYIGRLKPIFAERKLPAELVWVAEVESGFDARARSPAGAAGLFQLMPATAKRYGLRTWPIDQRLAAEPNARAAAQYLAFLHGHYQDWRLALAAYNAGPGAVDKLLARYKARTYDAIATRLPAETQMYVPKVEATLLRREGVKLAALRGPEGPGSGG